MGFGTLRYAEFATIAVDVQIRAKLVEAINQTLGGRYLPDMQDTDKQSFLRQVLSTCSIYITEPLDDDERISVGMRIWSGCLAAAKVIASQTGDGANSPQMRESLFRDQIDRVSKEDALFRAGVEAAPPWKRLINQGSDIFFDGVPADSPVRAYENP